MTDQERFEFIKELDESDVYVTSWEAGFIESVLNWTGPPSYTIKMQSRIDSMIEKYESRI